MAASTSVCGVLTARQFGGYGTRPSASWHTRNSRAPLGPALLGDLECTADRTMAFMGAGAVPVAAAFARTRGSLDGALLAATLQSGDLLLVDTRGGDAGPVRVTSRTNIMNNCLFDVAWSPDDEQLLVGCAASACKLLDTATLCCTATLTGHTGSVKSVCFQPGSRGVAASSSRDGSALLYDVRCARASVGTVDHTEQVAEDDSPAVLARSGVFGAHPGGRAQSVTCAKLLPDGRTLATSGARDGLVKLWDLRRLTGYRNRNLPAARRSPAPMRVLKPELGPKRSFGASWIDISACGSLLLASYTDGKLRVFRTAGGGDGPQLAQTYSRSRGGSGGAGLASFYVRATFSADARLFASGCASGDVWVGETANGPSHVLPGHSAESSCTAWSSTDTRLATLSDDATLRVWQLGRCGDGKGRLCETWRAQRLPTAVKRRREPEDAHADADSAAAAAATAGTGSAMRRAWPPSPPRPRAATSAGPWRPATRMLVTPPRRRRRSPSPRKGRASGDGRRRRVGSTLTAFFEKAM